MCWSVVHKWLLFSPGETELLPYSQLLSAPRPWLQSCLQTSGTKHNLNSISSVALVICKGFCSSSLCPVFPSPLVPRQPSTEGLQPKAVQGWNSLFSSFLYVHYFNINTNVENCFNGGACPPRMLILITLILIITDQWNKLNLTVEKMVWNWTEIIWLKGQLVTEFVPATMFFWCLRSSLVLNIQ